MEAKKPAPIWKRVLVFLGCCLAALFLWAFVVAPFFIWLIFPLCDRLTLSGKPLGIWILLGLLAVFFVWMLLRFWKGKHRLLSCFCGLFALVLCLQATPHLDLRVHTPEPVLAASFQLTDGKGYVDEQIYYDSFLYGSSMRSKPSLAIDGQDSAKLAELMEDHSCTWIICTGQEVQAVSWSYRGAYHYNYFVPWMIGVACPVELITSPGDPDTVYVYRIPIAPIDNIF